MLKKVVFICSVFLFSATLCAEISAQNVLIPRNVLLAQADKSAVSMNSAGNKIAYISRKGSEIELCVINLSGKLLRKFPIKAARNMYNFKWAYTNEHILIPQDENGNENDHIFCLNVSNGKITDLTPYKDSKSAVAKASEMFPGEIIITCNKRNAMWFDVYKVNIITGEQKLIFKNNEFVDFAFDDKLNLRFATKILIDGSMETYQVSNGKKSELFDKIKFEDSGSTSISHFNSDGNILYMIKSENRDTGALYAYNLKEKTSALLFENKSAEIDSITCHPVTHVPQAVTVEYLTPEIFVLKQEIEQHIEKLRAYASDAKVKIIGRSHDDNIWLVGFYSTVKSPKYYVYKKNDKSLKYLFSAQPELDRYQLQNPEPIVIKSRDGLNLVCYLTKAVDFRSEVPSKLIAYIHGGPWARDSYCLDKTVQLLANRGYSVLQINYRGSNGFGKAFLHAANKNLRKIRNDIIDAVNWAVKNKIADRKQIAIMGGSFGGYSTLAGLAFTPDVFCCGVDIVGPSNWLTTLKTVPQYWIPQMVGWYKLIGDPRTEEGRKCLAADSPISEINAIKKPLIVFQGARDPRVNKAESDQIVAALKAKKLPVSYVIYPDEGHGFLREQNRKSYLAIVEKFLANIMGGWFEPIQENEFSGSSYQILEGKLF